MKGLTGSPHVGRPLGSVSPPGGGGTVGLPEDAELRLECEDCELALDAGGCALDWEEEGELPLDREDDGELPLEDEDADD